MGICVSRLQSGNDAYDNIVDDFDKILGIVYSKLVWTV